MFLDYSTRDIISRVSIHPSLRSKVAEILVREIAFPVPRSFDFQCAQGNTILSNDPSYLSMRTWTTVLLSGQTHENIYFSTRTLIFEHKVAVVHSIIMCWNAGTSLGRVDPSVFP